MTNFVFHTWDHDIYRAIHIISPNWIITTFKIFNNKIFLLDLPSTSVMYINVLSILWNTFTLYYYINNSWTAHRSLQSIHESHRNANNEAKR